MIMKVLMRVSYSENNRYGTFSLSHNNHIGYCKRQNYTYMAVNAYNDLYEIYDLLKKYDIVFTCDSDIFITNIDKPISDFADKYLNLGRENWCPTQYSICNGGFLIFYRKDD